MLYMNYPFNNIISLFCQLDFLYWDLVLYFLEYIYIYIGHRRHRGYELLMRQSFRLVFVFCSFQETFLKLWNLPNYSDVKCSSKKMVLYTEMAAVVLVNLTWKRSPKVFRIIMYWDLVLYLLCIWCLVFGN